MRRYKTMKSLLKEDTQKITYRVVSAFAEVYRRTDDPEKTYDEMVNSWSEKRLNGVYESLQAVIDNANEHSLYKDIPNKEWSAIVEDDGEISLETQYYVDRDNYPREDGDYLATFFVKIEATYESPVPADVLDKEVDAAGIPSV